jgi:hypothetical protein
MEKQLMLQALEEKMGAYRKYRPSTAEMDIVIFRSFCSGKSAVRIAMDTPCAESTVYRAIRQVKDYLKLPEEARFMDILSKHIAENVPDFGDWNAKSVLEMLYVAYSEYNRFESEDSKAGYNTLYESLSVLSLKSLDKIIDVVADLCHYHERDGFTEGVKLGLRLGDELRG